MSFIDLRVQKISPTSYSENKFEHITLYWQKAQKTLFWLLITHPNTYRNNRLMNTNGIRLINWFNSRYRHVGLATSNAIIDFLQISLGQTLTNINNAKTNDTFVKNVKYLVFCCSSSMDMAVLLPAHMVALVNWPNYCFMNITKQHN